MIICIYTKIVFEIFVYSIIVGRIYFMLTWQLWSGTAEFWDQTLSSAVDCSVFQSYGWGEYKSRTNWIPLRYCCLDKRGNPVGMAQLLVKSMPFRTAFIWVPGGLVFRFPESRESDITELVQNLIAAVRINYPRSLIRFNSQTPNHSLLSYGFNRVCLRPYCKINSGYTVRIKLDTSVATQRAKMTAKHRYYTKKAAGAAITWVTGSSDQLLRDLNGLHQEMVIKKQLQLIATAFEELQCMRDTLGSKVLILVGYIDNKPVTGCLVLLFGSTAFYMVASTGRQGREVSAAYAMFERLMQELIEQGVTDFDFGGIDPVRREAAGVNHYKCGFGGEIVEQLGEWESAPSEWFRLAVNLALRFRGALP